MVRWREGTRKPLRSRFAAVRVRAAHRDNWSSPPRPAEWLLIEWPSQEAEPTRYWFSTLPAHTKLPDLVRLAKQRWIIERDYEELKQELGLATTKDEADAADAADAAFTITLPSASRPMGSWWPNGAVFSPPLAPVKWTYPSQKCRLAIATTVAFTRDRPRFCDTFLNVIFMRRGAPEAHDVSIDELQTHRFRMTSSCLYKYGEPADFALQIESFLPVGTGPAQPGHAGG